MPDHVAVILGQAEAVAVARLLEEQRIVIALEGELEVNRGGAKGEFHGEEVDEGELDVLGGGLGRSTPRIIRVAQTAKLRKCASNPGWVSLKQKLLPKWHVAHDDDVLTMDDV